MALHKISLLAVLLGTLAFIGCADRAPHLDKLGIDRDPAASGSGQGIEMRELGDGWFSKGDGPTASSQIGEANYDASKGFSIEEGTAGIVVMVAIFDDTGSTGGYKILQGDLRLVNPRPDVADVQLLPKELRRFVVVGKKQGHVDLKVTVDGKPGEITVPIDVVPFGTNQDG